MTKTFGLKQLLLLSSSKVHGYEYLEFAKTYITEFLKKNNVTTILFVPYALKDHDAYLKKVSDVFQPWGFKVDGIHRISNPIDAVKNAEAIFVGGGNTFVLLKALYDNKLIEEIKKRVLFEGLPYIGTSAGTNVATISIHTTNDMPIVYPPSFQALGLVPFNINPHYLDPEPNSEHKGETREERINQFLEMDHAKVVVGLREGTWLNIEGNKITLEGFKTARLFIKGKGIQECEPGSDLSLFLQ